MANNPHAGLGTTASVARPGSDGEARTLTALIKGDGRVALSLLTGVVAISGLLNQIAFYRFFGISYVAHIGASDFLGLVLQTIPFTLVVVLTTLLTGALTVVGAIYLRFNVVASLWRFCIGLWLACRLIVTRGCDLLAEASAWLLRLIEVREQAWPAARSRRIASIARRAQALNHRCQDYEPVCRRRARSSRRSWLLALRARRRSLRRWFRFANQHYLGLFSVVTLVILLSGLAFNCVAGYRLHAKLTDPGEPSELWRPIDYAFSFFFPGFLVDASLNVGGQRMPLNDVVFLGATSNYGFFLHRAEPSANPIPLIVPAREIELVTLAKEVPATLQKPEESVSGQLVAEQLGRIAKSVAGVGEHLEQTRRHLTALGTELFRRVAAPAHLSPDCRNNRIEGIDFRFALNDADPLAEVALDGPTNARTVSEYQNVAVRAYNEVQRARLVDYVTTTPFGYRRGDYLLVEGHASAEASSGYNEALAERRAEAVVAYLGAAEIWNEVEGFRRPGVIDAALEWQVAEQIRASFTAVGRGEQAWQNDPYDPRNRRVLVYHCRPRPLPLGDATASDGARRTEPHAPTRPSDA